MDLPNVGERVERLAGSDYTSGRQGDVVAIRHAARPQVQVHWTHDKAGAPLRRPVRTWVLAEGVGRLPK